MPDEFPTIETPAKTLGPAIERQFVTICRSLLEHPSLVVERDWLRISTGEPHPLGNFAVAEEPASVEAVTEAAAPLAGGAFPAAVILPGKVAPEVDALLTGWGFVLAESMPAMAVDIDKLTPTALPEGCEFQETTDPAEFADWCEALAVGYGLPRPIADLFGPAAGSGLPAGTAARWYAVSEGGRMVATSTLFLEGGLAGIYCVSTLPDERGKGLGAHATAEPLRRVRELGYRTGILQSSAMGESVYRKLGFTQFGQLPLYVRIPGG